MNESILLRFESSGRPLNIVEFHAAMGVTFDDHPEASPLTIVIGLQPVFPGLLDPVQRRHDWRDKQFLLDARLDSGGLRLSGHGGDPRGLPPGVYDLTIEVESYRFRDGQQRIVLDKGASLEIVFHEEQDLRRLKLYDNIDSLTERVLRAPESRVDGMPLTEWLASPAPRPARKACLLNILAKLRVAPDPVHGLPDPLTSGVDSIFFADVDRAYAVLRPDAGSRLEKLVHSKLWVREGIPKAPIHLRLRDGMSRIGVPDAGRFELTSYRQGGRNSLQMVVASPPGGDAAAALYADIDIDLGNPLWDLEGICVHLGELLDPARTDHLALHSKLAGGATADFLYYDILEAAPAAHGG